MSVRGRISHCETPARAAHRNETRGNAGDCLPSPKSTIRLLFEPGEVAFFLFLRGRRDEGVGGAITILARWLQHGPLNSVADRVEARDTERVRRRNAFVPKTFTIIEKPIGPVVDAGGSVRETISTTG
jgi:hypothetical protein